MSDRRRARTVQISHRPSCLAFALGLLMALAACGGGGGGGGSSGGGQNLPTTPAKTPIATLSSHLFPLDSNGVAVYSSTAGTESVVVRVAGTQLLADQQTATLMRRQDPSTATDSYRAYAATDAGLRQYAAAGADAIERAFDGSYVMRWPAYAGDSQVQLDTTVDSGMDFDGDGRADRVSLRADVTVQGLETVTVSAGTFSNALHLQQVLKQTVHPSSGQADQLVVTTTDTWYAPDIGIVKQVQAVQGAGAGAAFTQSLSKYRFGTRSNDTDAPFLGSFQPGTGPAGLATAKVVARFSEEMDEASFTPDNFAVTDAARHSVAGTLRVSGRTATFTPAQPLSSGTYYIVIGPSLLDLFGRPATASATNFFFIDATAPQVVATWPVADAINVALRLAISLDFSEQPGSASVNASTVRLTLDGAPVPSTVRSNDRGITIEPVDSLERGRHYEVAVNGVTDMAGNPMAQGLKFGFDTTPGRFSSAERIQPANNGSIGAFAIAVGDVNGDGIPDIVYADAGDEGYPDAVYLRAGRADGQFEAPVRLGTSTYFQASLTRRCPITALAIGDLTGDGRADVAVGSWNCGVLVLQQTASGSLEPGQFIDELIQVLRIADINGDGRLDLVGVENYWNKAFVWIQKPNGLLALEQTPGLGDVAGGDVAIGDMNGDGRPDLVVALRAQDTNAAHIAVLYQQADGSFSAPRYVGAGQMQGGWGIAVGDFNGDGRLDIATTTNSNKPTSILLYLQAADGSFPTATALSTMDGSYAIQAGDINGDGRTDLVVLHQGWFLVGIYLQQAGGTMAPEELYDAPGGSVDVEVLALADLNRDGLLDIVGPASILRQVPLAGSGALSAATRALRRTQQQGRGAAR